MLNKKDLKVIQVMMKIRLKICRQLVTQTESDMDVGYESDSIDDESDDDGEIDLS